MFTDHRMIGSKEQSNFEKFFFRDRENISKQKLNIKSLQNKKKYFPKFI